MAQDAASHPGVGVRLGAAKVDAYDRVVAHFDSTVVKLAMGCEAILVATAWRDNRLALAQLDQLVEG